MRYKRSSRIARHFLYPSNFGHLHRNGTFSTGTGVSDNVGDIKLFLSILTHALRRARHFALAFFPRTVDMVTEISIRIARDLRQQYTIGYVPEKKANAGEFRKVVVKISAPARGGLHVRTRPGYSTAPEKPSGMDSKGSP
jgi:hypothetical protein